MSVKKPLPPDAVVGGKICPVCGDRSYSSSGMHPQCAQQREETARSDQIIAKRKREEEKIQANQ